MANPIVHPEQKYKIAQIGPTRDWDFKTDNGTIAMRTFSIQLEGIADWVDYNVKSDSPAPKVGDEIEGHVEDAGKFGYKFTKKRNSNWSGGGKSSIGAQWSAAYDTAANIIGQYYAVSGKKPKSIDEFLKKVDAVAPKVKEMVDNRAGTAKTEEKKTDETPKTTSESGESPAPQNVEDDTINEDELNDF